jgi:beta-glucosidase
MLHPRVLRAVLLVFSMFLVSSTLLAPCARAALPYQDPRLPVEARVQDLLSRMTPTEKFWQLFMLAGSLENGPGRYTDSAFGFQIASTPDGQDPATYIDSIQRHFVEETRLGIPILTFGEALHGLILKDATAFPQAIGLAATWDTDLMNEVAGAVAEECRAAGIRMVLSPVVNIAADVRWGRTEETYGEDPFLASEMGVAFVSAFERRGVVTTPKHFVANVGDGGRDSYPIHWNERLLREIHLPPFEACIRRGGSRAVMTAYNSLDGTPCTADAWLNERILRETIGFTGFTISDACAVGGALVLHLTAADYPAATQRALEGGLDVIFQTSFDHAALFMPPFLDGRIPQEVIDRAVARVLRVKFELGLFEDPYAGTGNAAGTGPGGPAISAVAQPHRALALRAAQESIVLLKNEGQTLPLSPTIGNVAVLGPDAAEARLGGYSGPGREKISILEGIRSRIGGDRVRYAQGCNRLDPRYDTVPATALSCVRGDSVGPGLLGEYFDNITLTGAPVFRRVDPQLQFQWTLFSPDPKRLPYDFYSARWTGRLRSPVTEKVRIGVEGNDGYRLTIDGELVIDNWRKASCRSVLVERDFVKDRTYDLKLEYFESTGNARLRLVWDAGMPQDSDARMDEAVELAARSDAAIVVAGIEEGEFRDRARLALPSRQEELIRRVAATGAPTVVVLVGGSAITMGRWIDAVPAILDVWYPGEAGGEAVASVLLGDFDPAGRLPITFPVEEGQLPLVYNHKPTGRGDDYLDVTGQPLFPFGYGLSYTRFEYGDLVIEKSNLSVTDSTRVRCAVRNAGAREGDEVVQLYLHDELASVARPIMELKGFARVRLAPGEARDVAFTITPAMLAFLDRDMKTVVEPGDVRVMIGASSKDIRLRGFLKLVP